jgi:uncharacterized protein YlxW (UPF0749 family)
MRRTTSLATFTAVLVLLGFLVVVQLRSRAADDGLNGLSVQELGELVANLTAHNDQYRDQVRALEIQRQSVAGAVQGGDTSAGQIRSDLGRILGWSGALGVTGPGVRVTVEGSLPGDSVEELLNELRNAGAEAMAVGSIRVVPGVVVSGGTGSLSIDGRPLTGEIEITAVGQPETLSGSLTRAGGLIAQLAARHPDVVVTVNVVDRLDLPEARPAAHLTAPAPAPLAGP